MQKNKKVCAYVRAAAPIGAAEKLENQLEAIFGYCIENGLTVSYIYKEISSGIVPVLERTVGAKMYNDCLAGLCDTIIVFNFDRIGRGLYIVDDFLRIVENKGINVISVSNVTKSGNTICFDSELLQTLKTQVKAIVEARE